MADENKYKLINALMNFGINTKRIKELINIDKLQAVSSLLVLGLSKEKLEKLIDDGKIELVCDLFLDIASSDETEEIALEVIQTKDFNYSFFLRVYFIINGLSFDKALVLNTKDESVENVALLCSKIEDKELKKDIIKKLNEGTFNLSSCYESLLKEFLQTKKQVFKTGKIPEGFLNYLESAEFKDFIDRESRLFDFFDNEVSYEDKGNIIKRLMERKLTLFDYVQIPKLVERFELDEFIDKRDLLSAKFIFNEANRELILKYPLFFQSLLTKEKDMAKDILAGGTFENEDAFIRTVRDYLLVSFINNSFYIPDYFSEFSFEIVESYDTLEDMLKYNDRTLVKDSGQINLLINFSLDEIRKLQEKIKTIFKSKEVNEGNILSRLCLGMSNQSNKDILEIFYRSFLDSVRSVHDLTRMFNGSDMVFYDSIKYLDINSEDCKRYFSLGELNFIKYFQINFQSVRAFLDEIFQVKRGISFYEFINKYFDEKGLSLSFYKEALKNRVLLYALIKIDENYLEKYSNSEKKYIKVLLENPYISDGIVEKCGTSDNINKCFGENCSVKEFYLLLLSFDPSYIFKIDKNIIDKFFDEKGKLVYELLAKLKSEGDKYYKTFYNFVKNYETDERLTIEKIKEMYEIFVAIKYTNSREITRLEDIILNLVSTSNDPCQLFRKLELIFLKNELPVVGKIYKCFELITGVSGALYNSAHLSPTLKYSTPNKRRIIIFSDLLKAALGSNNRSINEYLKNIKVGTGLYDSLKSGQLSYNELNTLQIKELIKFRNHLVSLYYNTLKAKNTESVFKVTDDVVDDISKLSELLLPGEKSKYNLADRVVSMFCHYAGFDTLEAVERYVKNKILKADARNRQVGSNKGIITLEIGDYVKGIGDIKHFGSILQNGSRAKEHLGWAAASDLTELDTDVSVINSVGTISEQINATVASDFGPIWFILKNDDRFTVTREDDFEFKKNFDLSKIEVFRTSSDSRYYGIRTAFASSEINYIVCRNYDCRIGLEIAMNGFYIPVVDMTGRIVFTPEDYDNLRAKMSGLSYYSMNEFALSSNLVDDEINYIASQIGESKKIIDEKRSKINSLIEEVLEELGLKLKTTIDGDLISGYVEVINTGSTGRNTNKLGDGDFDFIVRLDKSIICDYQKLETLKKLLKQKFNKVDSGEVISTGDFRFKQVKLDDETTVDIDMSFVQRTDEMEYSTDMALKDRLSTIYRQSPEKYDYVLANIILAKKVLSEAEAYKSREHGGLGGVGIENWILQNGGSFFDAAINFLECAEGKSFDEFKSSYYIWDFGAGHYAVKRGQYPYRNFVEDNMSRDGYDKMVIALKKYVDIRNKDNFQNYDRH